MADVGGGERQFLGSYVHKQTKYGTTTKPSPKNNTYVKHYVSKADTLMGIALRYGATMEQVKRENKLWTNDSLFLREHLLVPVTNDNTHLIQDDWEIIKTDDLLRPRSVSANVNAALGSGNSVNNSAADQNGVGAKGKDFFSKYDTSIAQLKDNVDRMEKTTRFTDDPRDNPLTLLPRRHSEPHRTHASIENPDSPVLVIRSHTKSNRVKSAVRNSERANDELFEL